MTSPGSPPAEPAALGHAFLETGLEERLAADFEVLDRTALTPGQKARLRPHLRRAHQQNIDLEFEGGPNAELTEAEAEALLWLSEPGNQRHLMGAALAHHGHVEYMVESFDHYLGSLLPDIVRENPVMRAQNSAGTLLHEVAFDPNLRYTLPEHRSPLGPTLRLTPNLCRERGLTYGLYVLTNVTYRVYARDPGAEEWRHVHEQVLVDFTLLQQPLLVGSRYDPLPAEPGGFFLVSSEKNSGVVERSVLSTEKMEVNFPMVSRTKAHAYQAEVRSIRESKVRSTSTLVVQAHCQHFLWRVTVTLPFVTWAIPLRLILALHGEDAAGFGSLCRTMAGPGCAAHQDFEGAVRSLETSLAAEAEAEGVPEPLDILQQIGRAGCRDTPPAQRTEHLAHILSFEFLPHLGEDAHPTTVRLKMAFLAWSVARVLRVHAGLAQPDDRDHLQHVRLEGVGWLMGILMRQCYRQFTKGLEKRMAEKGGAGPLAVANMLDTRKLSSKLHVAISSGNWSSRRAAVQSGMTLPLNRQHLGATLSYIKRIRKASHRQAKNPKPRLLPFSAYGRKCAGETPEGDSCGLTNNPTLLAFPRLGHPSEGLLTFCYADGGVVPWEAGPEFEAVRARPGAMLVMVNGLPVGACADPRGLLERVRERRRRAPGWVPRHTSAYIAEETVFLATGHGELLRPLLVVSEMEKVAEIAARADLPLAGPAFFRALVEAGAVDYLSATEEEESRVALRPRDVAAHPAGTFRYLELHPASIFGLSASLIPFAGHNQSPRTILQCSMGKQAIPACPRDLDRLYHVRHSYLWYPQVPLVQTAFHELLPTAEQPTGMNVTMAMWAFDGYNMEDAVVMSRRLVDQGFFRATEMRPYRTDTRAAGTDRACLTVPNQATTVGLKVACYDKLDPATGCAVPGTPLAAGDVVIGKAVESKQVTREGRVVQVRDQSVQVGKDEDGSRVESVRIVDEGTHTVVRMRTAQTKVPVVGDKFSTRHGQKGVVSCLVAPEDMPFIPSLGISPDVMLNPHAINSRMTLGHQFENLLGLLCGYHGQIGDGTAFGDLTVDDVKGMLGEAGLSPSGTHVMYDGRTGEAYETEVFMGVIYYQKLRQVVSNMVHARARGPKHPITKQPTDGRSKDGGQRFGEMEKDCLVGHGAAHLIRDRLLDQSDYYEMPVCTRCGVIAAAARSDLLVVERAARCTLCGQGDRLRSLPIPYPCKLLFQECMAMNCMIRLLFEEPPGDEPRWEQVTGHETLAPRAPVPDPGNLGGETACE